MSINRAGSQALRSCVPAALFEKLVNSSANPSHAVTFLDHRLNHLLAITFARNAGDDIDHELPVSRIALRSILLEGLDPIIHFGKRIQDFSPNKPRTVLLTSGDDSEAKQL